MWWVQQGCLARVQRLVQLLVPVGERLVRGVGEGGWLGRPWWEGVGDGLVREGSYIIVDE